MIYRPADAQFSEEILVNLKGASNAEVDRALLLKTETINTQEIVKVSNLVIVETGFQYNHYRNFDRSGSLDNEQMIVELKKISDSSFRLTIMERHESTDRPGSYDEYTYELTR
jgi:hypothetical protein